VAFYGAPFSAHRVEIIDPEILKEDGTGVEGCHGCDLCSSTVCPKGAHIE